MTLGMNTRTAYTTGSSGDSANKQRGFAETPSVENIKGLKNQLDNVAKVKNQSEQDSNKERYMSAVTLAKNSFDDIDTVNDRQMKERVDNFYSQLGGTNSGAEQRGENYWTQAIEGMNNGMTDFFNTIGGGIDSAYDATIGEWTGTKDLLSGEDVGGVVDMAADIGLTAIPYVGPLLMAGKNLIQNSDELYEGIYGKDSATGLDLSEDEKNLARAVGLGGTALSFVPGAGKLKKIVGKGLGKNAGKEVAEEAGEVAAKNAGKEVAEEAGEVAGSENLFKKALVKALVARKKNALAEQMELIEDRLKRLDKARRIAADDNSVEGIRNIVHKPKVFNQARKELLENPEGRGFKEAAKRAGMIGLGYGSALAPFYISGDAGLEKAAAGLWDGNGDINMNMVAPAFASVMLKKKMPLGSKTFGSKQTSSIPVASYLGTNLQKQLNNNAGTNTDSYDDEELENRLNQIIDFYSK